MTLTDISLISGGGKARQVSDVLAGRLGPVEDNHEREQQTAKRIEPPNMKVEANYINGVRGQYKGTENQISRRRTDSMGKRWNRR